MMITIALCAALCAVILSWILAPVRSRRLFYGAAFAAAIMALTSYLAFGRPDLPAAPVIVGKGAQADYRQMMLDEFTMMDRLSKNAEDADAMIRLAALRLAQGRGGEETLRLLARAEALTPNDPRLKKIEKLMGK